MTTTIVCEILRSDVNDVNVSFLDNFWGRIPGNILCMYFGMQTCFVNFFNASLHKRNEANISFD